MRKFLFFLLFPFLLLSCEMQGKQSLCNSVAIMNLMCPTSVGDNLMMDSVLYKGKDKRVRFCYSYKESENREQYEEKLRNSDKNFMRYVELLDVVNYQEKNFLLYMTWADFDLQISYLDSKGNELLGFVYGKNEYNMSYDEVVSTFPNVMEESLREQKSKLPLELDLYTIMDSLSCDVNNNKVVLYFTIHDLNMDNRNIDTLFASIKSSTVENIISSYNLTYSAIYEHSWKFIYDYKMNGDSLSRFSVTWSDIDSSLD